MTVSSLPKGTSYTRLAMALAVAKGELLDAAAFAKGRWGEDAIPARVLKAAVAVGSLATGSDWGPALADFEAAQAEFFALVRQQSAVGRLAGLRRTPFQTRLVNQTGSVAVGWVEEGKPIPLTKMQLTASTLNPLKLAAIVAVSAELARSSSPDAEATIRADLINATADALDATFFNPANAGTAGVSPASITYGAGVSTGAPTDPTDYKQLIADFEGDLQRAYFIASPQTLAAISGAAMPNVGARGGEILGVPALPTKGIGDAVALIDPAGIAYGEDGGSIEVSSQASVEMMDDPTGPPTASTIITSLWQVNAMAIRTITYANWERVQAGAVRVMEAA